MIFLNTLWALTLIVLCLAFYAEGSNWPDKAMRWIYGMLTFVVLFGWAMLGLNYPAFSELKPCSATISTDQKSITFKSEKASLISTDIETYKKYEGQSVVAGQYKIWTGIYGNVVLTQLIIP